MSFSIFLNAVSVSAESASKREKQESKAVLRIWENYVSAECLVTASDKGGCDVIPLTGEKLNRCIHNDLLPFEQTFRPISPRVSSYL